MSVVAARPKAWGTTLFCDDMRHEIQGTVTLVGVYQGVIFINQNFPVMLPKLALLVKIMENPEEAFTSDGTLKIFFPGKEIPVFEMNLEFGKREGVAKLFPQDTDLGGLDKTIMAQIPIVFSPVQLDVEGSIRVRLYVDDVEYRIGAVVIKRGPIQASSTAFPPPFSQSPPSAPA